VRSGKTRRGIKLIEGKTALMAEETRSWTIPKRAMVLAAGLGTRMRAFNGQIPKPLVQVGGKALIDYVLDRLAAQGVERAVVNVHHLADQIVRHLARRQRPSIAISDERSELLGTGGGVIKALPELGQGPFFHVNSDTIWIDGVQPNLGRLAAAFDPARMNALLLVASTASSIGYAGRGDFSMAPDGRLTRRAERDVVPFVYSGAAILTPAFFAGIPAGASSMTPLFDRAADAERLFGLRLEGVWMHVGTPEAVKAAEAAIIASAA
jgi:MurNAc alpha-1-phosphate uridylyltransferase